MLRWNETWSGVGNAMLFEVGWYDVAGHRICFLREEEISGVLSTKVGQIANCLRKIAGEKRCRVVR
jgi:hypothetical protein